MNPLPPIQSGTPNAYEGKTFANTRCYTHKNEDGLLVLEAFIRGQISGHTYWVKLFFFGASPGDYPGQDLDVPPGAVGTFDAELLVEGFPKDASGGDWTTLDGPSTDLSYPSPTASVESSLISGSINAVLSSQPQPQYYLDLHVSGAWRCA